MENVQLNQAAEVATKSINWNGIKNSVVTAATNSRNQKIAGGVALAGLGLYGLKKLRDIAKNTKELAAAAVEKVSE